jgi:hypothetical protein
MRKIRNAHDIFIGKPGGGDQLGELDVDGEILLERNLGQEDGKVWMGASGSG